MKKKAVVSFALAIVLFLGTITSIKPVNAKDLSGYKIMYRLYNHNSGEHFYTARAEEKDYLVTVGWNDEGIGWYAPHSGDPVYRVYNPNSGDHHYTLNEGEKNGLVKLGWKDEGIGWYSVQEGVERLPLYRQYNPNALTGNHNYTLNEAEKNHLVSIGWNDEEIGWYAINKLPSQSNQPSTSTPTPTATPNPTATPEVIEKRYTCNHCGEKFATYEDWKYHSSLSTVERNRVVAEYCQEHNIGLDEIPLDVFDRISKEIICGSYSDY